MEQHTSISPPLLHGVVALLILATLEGKEMTGAALAHELSGAEKNPIHVSLPSIYRALKGMRKRGSVYGTKKTSNTRDVFYRMTEQGRKELWYRKKEWQYLVGAIRRATKVKEIA